MRLRQNRVYRSILLALTVVGLAGAGYVVYGTFLAPAAPDRQLKAAEAAYARGVAVYQAQNWGEAVTRFDEARLLADKGRGLLEEQSRAGRLSPDEVKALLGRLAWIKARAVRDRAYARSRVNGTPIGDVPDTQYGESYRGVMTIPDDGDRGEALAALRIAALYLRSDQDVLKDALRAELVRQPIDWGTAEPLLRAAIELNPKDSRAQYFLARFEFDQPVEGSGIPVPFDKKDTARVEKSRTHLDAARESKAPHWRVVGLETEIRSWEVRTAAARRVKAAAAATNEQALDRFLFDPADGAIGQIARKEHLTGLGRADVAGLANVLSAGLDRGVVHARALDGRPDEVRAVVRAALDLADATAGAAANPLLSDLAVAAVDLMWKAQALLAVADGAGWRDAVAALDAVVAKAGDAVRANPQVRLQLAQITHRDSLIALRSNDTTLAKNLASRAIKQAEDALASAEKVNPAAPLVDEYRLMLAEWKLLGGTRIEEVRPYLARARASAGPRTKLMVQFLDAVVAERQGRFVAARAILRPVAAARNYPDLAFRANLLTATLAITSGDPSAALAALREVEPVYQKLDDLLPTERAWAAEYIRGRDEVIALQVTATLELGLQSVARFRRDNPGRPVPADLLTPHETTTEGLMKKIRPPSPADRTARLAVAGYLALTGRRKASETRLTDLATDYPASLEVLRARTALLAVPENRTATAADPNAVAAGDVLIQKFIKDYPGDRPAKLYKAEWLVRTGRSDQAIEYLKDPGTFLGGRDDAVDRVLAAALYQAGLKDEAREILGRLPDDPAVTAILIRSAGSLEVGQAQLKEALSRFENKGLFQVYQGSVLLGQRKYPEAAAEFSAACAVSQVRPAARVGLTWALMGYLAADPTSARELAIKLAGEMTDEPSVYLVAALAALRLDDIGTVSDSWDQVRSMYAAVNKWEAVAVGAGLPRADAAVARAQFKLLAGDPVAARRDAVASLSQYPEHTATLILLADLFLSPPGDLTRVRDYYREAVRLNPADPRLPYLDARIRQADGDWSGAAAVYDRLIAAAPRNPTPYPPLVAALVNAGKKDEVLKRTRDWHARLPDDERATVTLIELLAGSGAGVEADELANEFVAHAQAEAGRRAGLAAPPSALPSAPGDAVAAAEKARLSALLDVAAAFSRANAFDAATARAKEVLKTRPADERARMTLGGIAVARGEWDAAVATYKDVLKDNPRQFVAGNNLAWILAEKKNEPAAALELVERVRLGPTGTRPISPERLPADFLDTLGVVYHKLNQPDRYREMQAVFEAAARRYPADPRVLLHLGVAQVATGDRARGLATLDAAVRLAKTRNGLKDRQNKDVIAAAQTYLKS
ncbi:tetratricopeptide repeat protein [Fimbriiglobus ruber]|uniref:TPR repeat protein n=1 Tax=Fimbriiglobus ruber TaxID=1908690 RepID=A0A225DFS7_9BACT|nr:tetratricopeptide repeat protein [Fimbriiglobus ruber]OWK35255.1 TPR repeat protein [Fimbriiglobus ruber]